MREAIERHDLILRTAVADHRGRTLKMLGDGVHAVFDDPLDAINATIALQRDLANATAMGGIVLAVRAGLHAGVEEHHDGDFVGRAVNRAARIMAAAHGGQILVSQAVAALVRDRLPAGVALRDLGEVLLRDLANFEHVYQLVHPALRTEFPALRTLTATPNNLPQALTRFIGHQAELNEYVKVIAVGRLVTLTGVGGCGKTRLAIELALRLLPRFVHGIWFVDLAPMADAERLPLTVARTLGLTERPGHPIVETLCEYLAEKQILLVLDNCEHLIGTCATLVTTMLGRARQLHVLATSREALGLPGEQIRTVRSLSCPPPDQSDDSDRVGEFEAVQLFVDCARLRHPGFSVDATVAPAVAEICRRLDGIPLAIELAAARIRVLSVDELREKLDDRFGLLVGGSRSALPRQQTLLATIKWSFDLLTPDERRLLERLAVFSGGWTLEGAVAVAGNVAQYEVLELLTHLVDKSLIATQRSKTGTTRYSMLETVRQYALETLANGGEMETTTGHHLEYYVSLAERLEPAIRSEEKGALEQLASELENLLLAFRACERLAGGSEFGLRLVAALGQYWLALGLYDLGYRLTTEALERDGSQGPSPARARALFQATRLAYYLSRLDEARDRGNECLALARVLHDDHLAAGALANLGAVSREFGDNASAIAYGEASLRLAREQGDAVQLRRALNFLGGAHRVAGNPELAQPLFEECLQLSREQRDAHYTAMVAGNLATTYIVRGELTRAWSLTLEHIDVSSTSKSKMSMRTALETVIVLAAAKLDWPSAARMLGAAHAERKARGLNLRDRTDIDLVSAETAMRKALGDNDFEVVYESGRAFTLEQAVYEARAWLEKLAPANDRHLRTSDDQR